LEEDLSKDKVVYSLSLDIKTNLVEL
jgi:hypothetical protein